MKRIMVRRVLCAVMSATIMACTSVTMSVAATDGPTNSIVSEQGAEQSGISDSDNGIDSFAALRDAATIKSSDIEKGAAIASPVVKIINVMVAILVALLMSWILFNSVVDLVCLCVSPFSRRVMALNTNPQQVPQDWVTAFAKLASEQAVHALMIASGGAASSNGGGSPMGGMGGPMGGMGYSGGMGMGPMGGMGGSMGGMGAMGGGAAAPAKPKSTLPIYLRKRVVMLILFGVCIVVFTCTAFTDIGIKLGNMLINGVSGFNM